MSTQDIHQAICDTNRELQVAAEDLFELATAAITIGFDQQASILNRIAASIAKVARKNHDAMGLLCQNEFDRAQESSANILKTAMAVAERYKDNPRETDEHHKVCDRCHQVSTNPEDCSNCGRPLVDVPDACDHCGHAIINGACTNCTRPGKGFHWSQKTIGLDPVE